MENIIKTLVTLKTKTTVSTSGQQLSEKNIGLPAGDIWLNPVKDSQMDSVKLNLIPECEKIEQPCGATPTQQALLRAGITILIAAGNCREYAQVVI